MLHKRVIIDIKSAMDNLYKDHGIHVRAEDNNMHNIHFILPGMKETIYEGGLYHGMVKLYDNYPFRPAAIYMITPNGRFQPTSYSQCAQHHGICLTLSTWCPREWSVAYKFEHLIINLFILMSLPCDGDYAGIGGITTSPYETKIMTKNSWNHLVNDPEVEKLFPDLHASLKNFTYKFIKSSQQFQIQSILNNLANDPEIEKLFPNLHTTLKNFACNFIESSQPLLILDALNNFINNINDSL